MSENKYDVLNEEFQNDCKVISMKYEYEGYSGEEQWAIISELSEKEILEKYKPLVEGLQPFVVLPLSYGEVRREFRRNENKHYMRAVRGHIFTLDDDFTEHHPETAIEDCMDQVLANEQSRELWSAIDALNEKQRNRLIAYYFKGKTYREIADEEGVDHKAVIRSVEIALRNIKIFLKQSPKKTSPSGNK